MLRVPIVGLCIVVAASIPATPLRSQEARPANVPVRELTRPTATSVDHFGLIAGVRGLSSGALLVNDARKHQLIMLDAGLRRSATVLDSVSGGGQSYGRAYTPIIPYFGDSTLYVDVGATSLVMITPSGSIGRVMAPPTFEGWNSVTRLGGAVDAHGDMIYRIDERRPSSQSDDTVQVRKAFTPPDSFFVVRAHFATRTLDTIGRVRLSKIQDLEVRFENNGVFVTSYPTLLPSQDDYAVLSDGSIAFVRGHDYHVDVLQPNGDRIAGPKLPFDWKRLTDVNKQSLIDSAFAKAVHEKEVAAANAAASRPGTSEAGTTVARANARASNTAAGASNSWGEHVFVEGVLTKDRIVDYYPPIRSGALKTDMNANLWILPTTSAQSKNGELIYDVVNNRGELTERVRIPEGRSIAGFGKNGEVYLMSRDAEGWSLERTFVRK